MMMKTTMMRTIKMIKRTSRGTVEKEQGHPAKIWNGSPVSIVVWNTDAEERTPGFEPLIQWLDDRHIQFSWCEWDQDGRIEGAGKKLPWEKEEMAEESLLEHRWSLQSDLIEVHVGHRWLWGFVPEVMDALLMEEVGR